MLSYHSYRSSKTFIKHLLPRYYHRVIQQSYGAFIGYSHDSTVYKILILHNGEPKTRLTKHIKFLARGNNC